MREEKITPAIIADPATRYGNGKRATRHFTLQRLSGAVNVVFALFLIFIVVRIAGQGYADVIALIGTWWIGIPFAALLAVAAFHMHIGMREIVEDYVHDAQLNRLSLAVNSFVAIAAGVIGAGAVLKIVFWG
jgi:succinate dehydrogenase / fumarate reductase membrane anchor subunit